MEPIYSSIVLVCTTIFLLTVAWRILKWAWIKPKKLEKLLRQQGLGGNHYKLLVGDLKEMTTSLKQAESKPIDPFTNDIAPRILPFFNNIINKFGSRSITWMGSTPALLLTDPELIKEVLTKNYIYQKPHSLPLAKLLAEGVGTYDTHKWSKHRRMINPAFHLEKLKHMVPAFYLSCSQMISKWEETSSSDGSFELDVWPELRTLTGDVISRTAFGSNYEEGRKIFELQKGQSDLFDEAIQSLYIPGMMFLPTRRNRRMKKIAEEVQSLVLNIIDKRLKELQGGKAAGDDLLGILLDSNIKEAEENGTNKSGLTSEEIVQECKLFYFAGYETTAMLLVWTLILLSKHPDWQARARDEVRQIIGTKKPDLEDLNQLKIVTMILHEVLRLYPPGTMISRRASEETKLGELRLPSDLMIIILSVMVHHDCHIWGDDAKEFNPERFRDGVAKATKGQTSYFPFGWGPRICIGQNFAMIEARMALAMILQRFSFEISPMYVHAPHLKLSLLQPQYGAQLILRKL